MEGNKSIGIKFGFGIGILYSLLLFWRWSKATNPMAVGQIGIITFLLIIVILFIESFITKKQNGGFITMKELFKTLFISVLIFELFYSIYNFIHFKYIDPAIISKMNVSSSELTKKINATLEKKQQLTPNNYDFLIQYTQPLKLLQLYITSIAVSGSIAALVAFIMKKNPTVAE